MPKFQIMSDLHQEFYGSKPLVQDEEVEGFLLLAGDITAGSISIDYLMKHPGVRVLGNHEFYRRHWYDCIDDHREMSKGRPMQLLENDTIVHEGVRIIGCSLWTDFLAPLKDGTTVFSKLSHDGKPMEWQGFYCKQMMADSMAIKGFTITGSEERHAKSLAYIKEMLSRKHDGPTIVMTHHAPSFKSSHSKYDDSAIKAGFCSDLDYVIYEYQPELWVHGHCHESFDYFIGSTRVICNPRGYYNENEAGFNSKLIVEL